MVQQKRLEVELMTVLEDRTDNEPRRRKIKT
jgi:hypothetical protein